MTEKLFDPNFGHWKVVGDDSCFWFTSVGKIDSEDENLNDQAKQQRNGENLRGLLRAYAGPWFGRDYPPPCDVKFNIQRFQHFNSIDDYNKYLILMYVL